MLEKNKKCLNKKFLFLSLRGLGDTVIQSQFILNLVKNNPYSVFYVITYENNKFVYDLNKHENLKVITIENERGFTFFNKLKIILNLIKLRFSIRATLFDYSIDMVGDIREFIISKFFASKIFYFTFSSKHLYSNMVIPIKFFVNSKNDTQFYLENNSKNIYSIYKDYFRFISKKLNLKFNYSNSKLNSISLIKRRKKNNLINIAFHPFASINSNNWPLKSWECLAKILIKRKDVIINIFCAENDKTKLKNFFQHKKIKIKSLPLNRFSFELKKNDLSICSDSFSSHISHFLKINSIIIYGSNDHRLFQPPGTIAICENGGCNFYPCFNKPKCIGTNYEYSCINSISCNYVYNNIKNILENYR